MGLVEARELVVGGLDCVGVVDVLCASYLCRQEFNATESLYGPQLLKVSRDIIQVQMILTVESRFQQ